MFENLIQQVAKVIHRYEEREERPSEEATKHALVLPFIRDVLGADYLNPEEVIPEFTADIGERKGEKVDYAICRADEPVILIECKSLYSALDNAATIQLERYVNSRLGVSLGILTNGRHYRFYADLDKPNILDAEPFLSVDLMGLTPEIEERLKLFRLGQLDVERIKQKGQGWKAVASLVQALENEWKEPSDGYVIHFARPLHQKGSLTESVRRQYAGYLQEAHQIFLSRQTGSSPWPDPTSDEWQPLTKLDPTEMPPQMIQFEDGSMDEVKNWAELFRIVACKLAAEGHFRTVPNDLSKIIRKNPPPTKTPWMELPDGQYIRNHGSATDRLNIVIRLLTASGCNPAKCTVKLPRDRPG